MNPLAIFTVLTKIGAVVRFGKILWALPKFYQFAKKFGPVANDVLKNKRLPNGSESVEFLNATANLLKTGAVDFPGVDEDEIAKKLETLAAEIEGKKAA